MKVQQFQSTLIFIAITIVVLGSVSKVAAQAYFVKQHDEITYSAESARNMVQTSDGNFQMLVTTDSGDIYLYHLDTIGNLLDTISIYDSATATLHSDYLIASPDQSIFDITVTYAGGTQYYLNKRSNSGILTWTKTMASIHADLAIPSAMTLSIDSNILIGSYKNTQLVLAKVDLNGSLLWIKYYNTSTTGTVSQILQDDQSNIYLRDRIVSGSSLDDKYFIKTDKDGTLLKNTIYPYNSLGGETIRLVKNGILVGTRWHNVDTTMVYLFDSNLVLFNEVPIVIDGSFWVFDIKPFGSDQFLIMFYLWHVPSQSYQSKFYLMSSNGLIEGIFDIELPIHQRAKFLQNSLDNRLIVYGGSGDWILPSVFISNVPNYIFTDQIKVTGHVSINQNDTCLLDSINWFVNKQVIGFQDSLGFTNYTVTDKNGYYSIFLYPGQFNVVAVPKVNYVDAVCTGFQSFSIDSTDTCVVHDLTYVPLVYCPGLAVEISSLPLAICRNRNFDVEYCNYGTATAVNSIIQVEFDTSIVKPTSSTLPWSNIINGTIYEFNLGNVDPLDCDNFRITTSVACDSSLIGSFHCVEARIFPDTICLVDSLWDMSSISVSGFCIDGDSVEFKVFNVGSGNMSTRTNIHVIEDDILIKNDSILLNSNDSVVYNFTASGNTYILLAEQVPNHPGRSNPFAVVYGCGGSAFWPIVGIAADDFNPFVDQYCTQVLASYDPNDKIGFPLGVTDSHYISNTDNIEYLIRFQNTGTDTAHKVVIRDTISPHLDLLSILPGVSSHNYTFSINPGGVAVFTFNNIALPDSGTNEPASHGYIKYTVELQPNLPIGTRIENTASIIFDINAPIRTNTTFHTIGEIGNTHWFLVSGIESTDQQIDNIIFYPNPFTDEVFVEIESAKNYQNITAEIYDLQGRMVGQAVQEFGDSKLKFNGSEYQNGLYIIRVLSENNELLGTGKIIKY